MIEMRSDTFTLPTGDMMAAIAAAPLGDDVYGEDRTVRVLEETAAHTLGKESACLMPSGTMANLAAIMAHCPRGAKVLVGAESDIYLYEAAGAVVCGGVTYEPLPNQPDGTLLLNDLRAGLAEDAEDPQFALPGLICLENTQNRCGGVPLSPGYQDEVRRFADEQGLPVHLDGARLFNAAVALGVSPAEVARAADSVQFCLSKGLGAPIGSVVAGSADFIASVHRIRKMLGGGMRQAGIVASAGLVALADAGRLAEDHANARAFAEGLAEIPGIEIDPDTVRTNILLFRVVAGGFTPASFVHTAHRAGLRVGEFGHGRIRAVLHSGVSRQDVTTALDRVAKALAEGPA
ncbi:GntG family PLP-dependent aldolase [Streptomyces violaceoruber]|uniref:GntG family PLP-dependent aldolase n=1 Tax=Streptomyces violaceoruber group TaxID=2867121 RepID=UPI0033FDFA76